MRGIRRCNSDLSGASNIFGTDWARYRLWMASCGRWRRSVCAASFLDKAMRNAAFFILTFIAFSGLALSSGFLFREHYFIFVLPAICLLVAWPRRAPQFLFAAGAATQLPSPCHLCGVLEGGAVRTGASFCRNVRPMRFELIYGPNPFPEAVRVAEYLREHTNPTDTIAILGSEPEIYFYAHRHSATGYIYTVWIDGAPEVCRANAARNDAGNRGRAAKISGFCRGYDILAKAARTLRLKSSIGLTDTRQRTSNWMDLSVSYRKNTPIIIFRYWSIHDRSGFRNITF